MKAYQPTTIKLHNQAVLLDAAASAYDQAPTGRCLSISVVTINKLLPELIKAVAFDDGSTATNE